MIILIMELALIQVNRQVNQFVIRIDARNRPCIVEVLILKSYAVDIRYQSMISTNILT